MPAHHPPALQAVIVGSTEPCSVAGQDGHIKLHRDLGENQYYLQDLRTHEVVNIISPPNMEDWELLVQSSDNGNPYCYIAAESEAHWVATLALGRVLSL